MTADELAIFQAATQIYISRETRLHGRKDSDLRFEAAEKARLRFQAADEARALYQHVYDMRVNPFPDQSMDSQNAALVQMLDRHNGNVATAALELGCSRKAIYDRVKRVAPHYFKSRLRPRRYDIPVEVRIKEEISE